MSEQPIPIELRIRLAEPLRSDRHEEIVDDIIQDHCGKRPQHRDSGRVFVVSVVGERKKLLPKFIAAKKKLQSTFKIFNVYPLKLVIEVDDSEVL